MTDILEALAIALALTPWIATVWLQSYGGRTR